MTREEAIRHIRTVFSKDLADNIILVLEDKSSVYPKSDKPITAKDISEAKVDYLSKLKTTYDYEVPVDKSDEFEEYKLNEDKDCYLRIGDIVDRFKEIDEHYNHSPWTLTQIFSNLNVLQRVGCKAEDIVVNGDEIIKYLMELPPVYPKSEVEDCVSRKNILESLNGAFPSTDWNKALFRKIVLDTPSVYPKSDKPSGKWMKDEITERSKVEYKYKCNQCGCYHRAMYDYCPSCGAKMEKGENI